ncbi:ABC transporter ATP-binding protein [Deferribacter autotrophicus]|uniref:ABC transporter ATP-binding protein n=1 Tax=Deferribacter autotrophicus TaxID=500465 RepID=A0A5A8F8Q8_9BACT|nr:ABC transporter ATP-binding protein [Deferribacter autotrophicus]KAA0259101.1 ABC transporter ATP-binding protein [Deferribacter autotrophicus]
MIELVDVSCSLSKKTILKGISYQFKQKQFYSIFGKSGSGKSTLLKCLVNLIPFEGEIKFHNKDITDYQPAALRTSIIYLHQEPVLLGDTVDDDLKIVFNLKINKEKNFDKNLYLNYLKIFGYDEQFLEKKTDELSGGQKQIAAILRSIVLQPDFLLLDEPTSALDINTENQLISLLKQIKDNIGVITVSHSVNLIRQSDVKILFKDGKLYKTFNEIDETEIKQVLDERYN